uniref:Uncharacterized protein n=1 Tax=Arundo donax TaxID=35708 RepID=A0A0A9GLI3_ARUDO
MQPETKVVYALLLTCLDASANEEISCRPLGLECQNGRPT